MKTAEIRFHELDALRGLAALTVVFHHYYFIIFPEEMFRLGRRQKLGLKMLYPFVAGHEAVMLFFILSGFVLAVPYLRGKGQPYFIFLLRRVLRIYCPYLFALALAVTGAAIWHGHLGLSGWPDRTWSEPVSGKLVLQHILFLGNYHRAQFNVAFWSLVYEMRISIIFPFLYILINKLRVRDALLTAAGCSMLALATISWKPWLEQTMMTLEYTAIFICGILVAKNLGPLSRWYHELSPRLRVLAVLCSFLLYNWGHLAERFHRSNGLSSVSDWPITLGAMGYVLIGLNSTIARRFLNSPVPLFLGRISYSLYLVHSTVLFALTFTLYGKISQWLFFAMYVVGAILLGTVFCFWIEEPFLRMGRRVGRWSVRPVPVPPLSVPIAESGEV